MYGILPRTLRFLVGLDEVPAEYELLSDEDEEALEDAALFAEVRLRDRALLGGSFFFRGGDGPLQRFSRHLALFHSAMIGLI
jgi:hypothetical protein